MKPIKTVLKHGEKEEREKVNLVNGNHACLETSQ
jgi:hypothetical protein